MANIRNNNRRKKRKPGKATSDRRTNPKAKAGFKKRPSKAKAQPEPRDDGKIRLNRFISNCGVCSRREADVLIKAGAVAVNGKVVTDMGIRVDPRTDAISYDGETIRMDKMRYVLLNKPKNYVAATDDPKERRNGLLLVQPSCKEAIYPVGKLDRLTVGLMLYTNDGDMAKRLLNPRQGFPKLYHVTTAQKVKQAHLDMMLEGFKLDEGFVKADKVAYVGHDQHQVGIEIHSGRNRIVRRIFEHFGYNVSKLDRVKFGPLTKKDLPRGHSRHLTEQEVQFLQMVR